jgi:hypothetical protein
MGAPFGCLLKLGANSYHKPSSSLENGESQLAVVPAPRILNRGICLAEPLSKICLRRQPFARAIAAHGSCGHLGAMNSARKHGCLEEHHDSKSGAKWFEWKQGRRCSEGGARNGWWWVFRQWRIAHSVTPSRPNNEKKTLRHRLQDEKRKTTMQRPWSLKDTGLVWPFGAPITNFISLSTKHVRR